MKSLVKYITEKLVINKDFKDVSISSEDYDNLQNLLVFMYKPNSKPNAYLSIIGISLDELGMPNKHGEHHLEGSSVTGFGNWAIDVKYDVNNQLVATKESINNNGGSYYVFIPVSHIKKNLNAFDNLSSFKEYTPAYIDKLFNIFTYEYIDKLDGVDSEMSYSLNLSEKDIEKIKKFIDDNS